MADSISKNGEAEFPEIPAFLDQRKGRNVTEGIRTVVEEFHAEMKTAGITTTDDIVPDGKLRRIYVEGDNKGRTNGWYVLYADSIPAGKFGCWKRDISKIWCAKSGQDMSQAERQDHQRRVHEMRRQRDKALAERQAEARETASQLWNQAKPANAQHPYLAKKCVGVHSLRQHNAALYVPVRDADDRLHSLQLIKPDGGKIFLPGGAVTGHFHRIGGAEHVIIIAEGYATTGTLFEATGYMAIVAFYASNLLPVAETIRSLYPGARLIIVADDDRFTDGNPGLTKAKAAAAAVGGYLVVPDFADGEDGTDWNDYAAIHGRDAVAKAISEALKSSPPADEDGAFEVICLADVKPEPVDWLWKDRIASGKLSVLAGDPGLGKSTLTISIAAHLTRGLPWPVDGSSCPQGDVILLSAEDDRSGGHDQAPPRQRRR